MAQYRKSGQGAFELEISETDGRVRSLISDGSEAVTFSSVREAYDHYRDIHDQTGDHAAWNICYHLEDYLHDGASAKASAQ